MEKTEQRLPSGMMDAQLDDLEEQVRIAFQKGKDANWRSVWNAIRSASSLHKQIWFESIGERRASWDRLQSVAQQVQRQRDEAQKRWTVFEDRKKDSRRAAEKILALAQQAWPHEDGFIQFLGTITGANMLAELIAALIELGVRVLTLGLLTSEREDTELEFLRHRSEKLQEAWTLYHEHSERFLFEDRRALREVLLRVQSEVKLEWDKFKGEKRKEYLDRTNRKESLIAEAKALAPGHSADTATAKALMSKWKEIGYVGDKEREDNLWITFRSALDRFWKEHKDAGKDRVQRALEATRANVEKLRASVEHDKGVLEEKETKLANVFDGRRAEEIREHLRAVVSDLEEKIERKQSWIAEQVERIEEMERVIVELL